MTDVQIADFIAGVVGGMLGAPIGAWIGWTLAEWHSNRRWRNGK